MSKGRFDCRCRVSCKNHGLAAIAIYRMSAGALNCPDAKGLILRAYTGRTDFRWRFGSGEVPGLRCVVCGLQIVIVAASAGVMPLESAGATETVTATKVCLSRVPQGSGPIAVTGPDDGGIFHGGGKSYFLTDIHARVPLATQNSVTSRQDVNAVIFEAYSAGPANRWDTVPAWIIRHDGQLSQILQERLIESGQAIVSPDLAGSDCLFTLKQAESRAQRAGRGVWQHTQVFSTGKPSDLLKEVGHYIIAEGRIVSLGKTRRTRYLNFGYSWKSDFTVTLKVAEEAAFESMLAEQGYGLDGLEGTAVRVRGVVQRWDGPHIELVHPGQLDVIEPVKGRQ